MRPLDNDLRPLGGWGIYAVDRRLSTSPRTVCLVRAEGKDPLDKLVTTMLRKDHCEYTARWQLVPVEMEEMHTIVTAKGLCGLSRIRYRRS
jgi:hypothetical protein